MRGQSVNGELLTISGWPRLLDPVCEMTDEVKEEISLRDADHFVSDFNKQTEAFTGPQVESLPDILTEILGSCRRINLKSLKLKFA